MILTIDDILIPDADIISIGKTDESIEYAGDKLIASTMGITLDNTDDGYSLFSADSIFYGSDFYNVPVKIFDEVNNIYTWIGRVKDVKQDSGKKTIQIESKNYVRDLADSTVDYTSTAETTPAEHILYIINTLIGIDAEFINAGSFQDAVNIQDAASIYVDITAPKDKNYSALQIIEMLLRLTQCHLYTVNNIITLFSWADYTGDSTIRLRPNMIIPGTFESRLDTELISNDYNIAYDDSGSVAYAETVYDADDIVASTDKYGTITFSYPEEKNEDEAPPVLLQSEAAAHWCGNRIIDRNIDLVIRGEIQLDWALSWLALNDVVMLDFDDFRNEPVRITSIERDSEKRTIRAGFVFLNFPLQRVIIDQSAPASPLLVAAMPAENNTVKLLWTAGLESDLLGYKIYLTTTPGQWYQESCDRGQSPVEIKSPSMTSDGLCTVELSDLGDNVTYYFKVSAIDTSYNESDYSNILTITTDDTAENLYCLTGNIYTGITLDTTNAALGVVPEEYLVYDDIDGDGFSPSVVTAVYTSQVVKNKRGLYSLTLNGSGLIAIKWRSSNDGITWGVWSEEVEATAKIEVLLDGSYYVQYMILFYSASFSDDDATRIEKITEAA